DMQDNRECTDGEMETQRRLYEGRGGYKRGRGQRGLKHGEAKEDGRIGRRGGLVVLHHLNFFFSSRRRHTRCLSDWSSDVCSSDLSVGDAAPTRCPAWSSGVASSRSPPRSASPASTPPTPTRRRPPDPPARPARPAARSEERRVGKEGRSRASPCQ